MQIIRSTTSLSLLIVVFSMPATLPFTVQRSFILNPHMISYYSYTTTTNNDLVRTSSRKHPSPSTISRTTQIEYSSLPYQNDDGLKKQLKDLVTDNLATSNSNIPSKTTSSIDTTTTNMESKQDTLTQIPKEGPSPLPTTTTNSARKRKSRVTSRIVPKVNIPNVHVVTSLDEFQHAIQEYGDGLIVVRFYATWCKACRAIAPHFYKLARKHTSTTFLEIPILQENSHLHQGLNVHAIPSCHIYHPSRSAKRTTSAAVTTSSSSSSSTSLDEVTGGAGSDMPLLMEELKMERKSWSMFTRVLEWYVYGSCDLEEHDLCSSSNYGFNDDDTDTHDYLEVEDIIV